MDLSLIGKFEFETASVGTVFCGSPDSIRNSSKLEEYFRENKDPDGKEFSRFVLGLVGSVPVKEEPEDENAFGKVKYKDLSEDDLGSITDDELEEFARRLLEEQPQLKRSSKTKPTSEEAETDEGPDPSPEEDFTELQIQQGETHCDFLVRALRRYTDEHREAMMESASKLQKMAKQMIGGSGFEKLTKTFKSITKSSDLLRQSTAIQDLLSKNSIVSSDLRSAAKVFEEHRKAMDAIGGLSAQPKSEISHMKLPQMPENPAHETNRRLNKVLDQMAAASPLLAKAASLMDSMNETVLGMQKEYNANARKTDRRTTVMIFIAMASLIVSAVFSWLSYSRSEQDSVAVEQLVGTFSGKIDELVKAQDDRQERLMSEENRNLQQLVSEQDLNLQQLINSMTRLNEISSLEGRQALENVLGEVLRRAFEEKGGLKEEEPVPQPEGAGPDEAAGKQ